jgi:tetratricopeptide (TPR) repeat protein
MEPIRRAQSSERTTAPFSRRPPRLGVKPGNLRDWWWWLLDLFDASRAARVALYLAATTIVAGVVVWYWAYPAWNKHNAVTIARKWLAAGQVRYAAEAAQQAAELDPENPAPWQIGAELARLGGQYDKALEYSRHAAQLAPTDTAVVINWAAAALRANQPDETDRALDQLPIEVQAASADVQRLRGELARRAVRLTAAQGYFEAALRLEGSLAVNEVPLGLILLNSRDPAVRQRGLALLGKWTADREWGATALRTLLTDALNRGDRAGMRQWADGLLAHPRHNRDDMRLGLQGLSQSDEARFAAVLAGLEKDHAVTPAAATQLLSWLNQIGRGAEAVRWMRTLPAEAMHRPPLAVAAAEALRLTADWPALRDWTTGSNWGTEAEFLRWTYALEAARMLGEEVPADDLERTLFSHAQLNSVHGLFAASTLYSWGRTREAETLWWRVAEQESQLAIEALGSLARHYQGQRDAEGLYRVFRRLNLLRPQDPDIGNNFAFYAALTGREQRLAERISRANLTAAPQNVTYLATCAFTLTQQSRNSEALALLAPKAAEAGRSPALAFAYGLALASSGRKAEARPLLNGLPPETLTLAEVALIKTMLGN